MSYSQNQEETIILSYFKDVKGHLLDLGANDGKTYSNSLKLIELGWSADLVEASPDTFVKLQELHKDNKNVKCHNFAISNVNGTVIFNESGTLLGGSDRSLVSTLDKREIARWQGKVKYKELEVESKTFNNFLNCSKSTIFDFITIDIEGMDWIVLTQMDLTKLGVKMLIVETNGIETLKYISYCNKFGLTLLDSNQENIIMSL